MATTGKDHEDVVGHYIKDGWNEAALELVDEPASPDAKTPDPTLPGRPDGPDGVTQAIQSYHSAFPDAHIDNVAGRIRESWVVYDTPGTVKRLGDLPTSEETA